MKVIKIIGYLLATIAVIIVGTLTYVKLALPDVGPAAEIKVEPTPERIARGRYLANHVSVCMDCHSKRDFSKFSGPPTEGTLGMGGDVFDQSVGMPGVFVAKNITPEGISRYSDGELFRVITTGVTKEGAPMFPLMPYTYYGRMDPDDIHSIIAYVRSITPIKNEVRPSAPDFPMNFILNTLPQKANPQKKPDPTDMLAYGSYMTNAAGCRECHTQVDKGQIIESLAFSGGREFGFPDGSVVRSSNISPDVATGIGSWTEEMFVNRFQMYADSTYELPSVAAGEFNTIMPWTMYAGMTREDLAAIFAYLKSQPAMQNQIVKYSPPSK